MAGKSGRPKLILSPEQKEELARLSHSRGSPAREVQRAQILCRFEAGESITQIARTETQHRYLKNMPQLRDQNTAIRSASNVPIASSHCSSAMVGVQGPNVQIRIWRLAASPRSESRTARRIVPMKGVYR